MAFEKTDDVKFSEETFRIYQGGNRGDWITNVQKDRDFKIGNQWSEEQKAILDARGQMAIPVNEVLPTIDLVISQLTENDPRFTAVGRESSDSKIASYVADLFSWIYQISKGRTRIRKFVGDFIEVGVGWMMAYIDPYADNGKGEIKIIDVDPDEVYVDPSSKEEDASDASHILVSKILSKSIIESTYPDFDFTNAKPEDASKYTSDRNNSMGSVFDPSRDRRESFYRVIDRYSKTKIERPHIYDPNSNEEKIFDRPEDLKAWMEEEIAVRTKFDKVDYLYSPMEINMAKQMIQQLGNTFHYMIDPTTQSPVPMPGTEMGGYSIPNSTTNLDITLKGMLLEKGIIKSDKPKIDRIKRVLSIGGVELANEILPIEDYPIVASMLHHTRTPFPMGDIRLVAPLQEQLNKIDNLIVTYNQNITNVKMFVQRGSGLKKELESSGAKAGAQYYEMDMDTDKIPYIVQLTQMSSSFYQQRENLIRQIQRIIGSYSFQDGDASQAPRTSSGTTQVDEMMQRRTASKKRKIEDSLNQLAKVITQLIPLVYTDRKVIRLSQANHGKPKETILNDVKQEDGEIKYINDVCTMKYDVQVLSGSMLPINKWQQRNEMMQYMAQGILKDPTPIIRLLDLPNVDEIIEREDALKNAMGTIQQLEEAIKDLQGQVQTLSREKIRSDNQIETEKFKSQLKGEMATLKAAVQTTTKELNKPTKKEQQ